MIFINPLDAFLWSIRRNQKDVIRLYDTLAPLMRITSDGSNMLNFGYWTNEIKNPIDAQVNLCKLTGKIAELESAKKLLDVGSGFSSPSILWKQYYPSLKIFGINTSFTQHLIAKELKTSDLKLPKKYSKDIRLINSTSTKMPFVKESVDRIISLESAQHFKPLTHFIRESKFVLKSGGLMVIVIPVITKSLKYIESLVKLGILSFTWASEHYLISNVLSLLEGRGFKLLDIINIGEYVYCPLKEYYVNNRQKLKEIVSNKYNPILEYILYKSILKMDILSKEHLIDYSIIKIKKL